MRKVIFLDIDGVLNSKLWNDNHQKEISNGILIDVEKIKLLSLLIKNSGAEIILHSGWKYWFDSDLKPLCREAERLQFSLNEEGLKIAGVTPDHATEEIRQSKRFSLVKAGEILAWLSENKDVTKWIVIDDLDLHNEEIEKHQIRTDANNGLTKRDVCRAEKLLERMYKNEREKCSIC